MKQPCAVLHNEVPCGLEKEGASRYCRWDRYLKASIGDQITLAHRRRDAGIKEAGGLKPDPPTVVADGWSWCSACFTAVPSWYGKGKRIFRCIPCAREQDRKSALKSKYDITPAQYEQLDAKQDGLCAMCDHKQRDRSLAVDHNHTTGEVRGLLCVECNHKALGGLHDSARRAWKAFVYLSLPPAQRVEWERSEPPDPEWLATFLLTRGTS